MMKRCTLKYFVILLLHSCKGLPAESSEPSLTPTSVPTVPLENSPSVQPYSSQTSQPSLRPLSSPTARPTRRPTFSTQGPLIIQNVQMQLNGADLLSADDQLFYESRTKAYIESYYSNEGKHIVNSFYTDIKVTRVQAVSTPYPMTPSTNSRQLANNPPGVLITYDQYLFYRPSVQNANENNTLVTRPFNNIILRNKYISFLQSTNRSAFMSIKSVEIPVICTNCKDPGNMQDNLPLIIGVSAGGGAALILLIVILWFVCSRRCKRKNRASSYPNIQRKSNVAEDSSNLEPPNRSTKKNAEESSVVSVDYDYSRAYVGGNEQSVSSAGGTLGSATRRSKISGLESKGLSGTTLSTDEASFEARFRKRVVREETLIIVAPPGKLGVVIDSPEVGGPVVHAIKDGSVLANKLSVGDRLIAVDDEDVRSMSAVKVSKLISRNSQNAARKLTIIRSVQT